MLQEGKTTFGALVAEKDEDNTHYTYAFNHLMKYAFNFEYNKNYGVDEPPMKKDEEDFIVKVNKQLEDEKDRCRVIMVYALNTSSGWPEVRFKTVQPMTIEKFLGYYKIMVNENIFDDEEVEVLNVEEPAE